MLTPSVVVMFPVLLASTSSSGIQTMPNRMPNPCETLLAISCFKIVGWYVLTDILAYFSLGERNERE